MSYPEICTGQLTGVWDSESTNSVNGYVALADDRKFRPNKPLVLVVLWQRVAFLARVKF